MPKVCLILDVSQKLLTASAFNEHYKAVFQSSISKKQQLDEDGVACDDLEHIIQWAKDTINKMKTQSSFEIVALNFTAYAGANVHLNKKGKAVTPVYNPNRPLAYKTKKAFLEMHGDEEILKTQLQIPFLSFESLALQLFWLKHSSPKVYQNIAYSLSLPNFLSSLFSKAFTTEYSSLGVHSASWHFEREEYHSWLKNEGFESSNLPYVDSSEYVQKEQIIGHGVYNKVAELEPLLATNHEQFILLSTGAWTVCINPFNRSKSTLKDINHNCFNILNAHGKIMKMARLFSGNEHERQIRHLASHFSCDENFFLDIKFDREIIKRLRNDVEQFIPETTEVGILLDCPFMDRNLNIFNTIEDSYHQFIMDLIAQQVASIKLTFDHQKNNRIYVVGGLAKNEVFMKLLAEAFHDKQVCKVNLEHLSSLGASMLIGSAWTSNKLNKETLQIKSIG